VKRKIFELFEQHGEENLKANNPLFNQFFRSARIELERKQRRPLKGNTLLRLRTQVREFLEQQVRKIGLKKLSFKMAMVLMMTFFFLSLQSPILQAAIFQRNGGTLLLDNVYIGSNSSATFVDIDNDGDKDVFIGKQDGTIAYYRNDGTITDASFNIQTNTTNPFNGVNVGANSKPTFVDIDNDGDMDAFIGNSGGTILYYRNNGSAVEASFDAQIGVTNPFNGVDVGLHSAPTFVDIDNDGDLDVFIGEQAGLIFFYRNDGTAFAPNFVIQGGAANPFNGLDVGSDSVLNFVDIDNDGDMDAFIGNRSGTIKHYINSGNSTTPSFIPRIGPPLINAKRSGWNRSDPAFVDIDNDGDMDTFVGNGSPWLQYYENNGTSTDASFDYINTGNRPLSGSVWGSFNSPTFVDIDNDGDMDAFIGNETGEINYFRNNGTAVDASFDGQSGIANPFDGVIVGSDTSPAFVDIDKDGDMDAFIGDASGDIFYYRNNGTATDASFAEQTGVANPFDGVDVGAYSTPTFADIDKDGDMDAFIGEQGGTILYYQNDGTATVASFVAQTDLSNFFDGTPDVGSYSTPTFVDIDNDGDMDLYIGNSAEEAVFFKNTTPVTNLPPTAPVLVSPEDGATGLSEPISVTWNPSTDPDGDTLTYTVQVCKDAAFSDPCLTFIPIAAVQAIATYGGFGGFAAALLLFLGAFFRKAKNRAHFVKGVLITLIFGGLLGTCARSDSGGGSSDSTSIITGSKSATLTGLEANTTYYWKVVADDGNGETTDSTTRSFTTQ